MNKLMTNVSKLSTLFMSRAQLRAEIQADEDKIAARELVLTPTDGWIGKNEGERTTSKMRAFAADPDHCKLSAILRGFQVDLGKCLAEIEGLQADTSAVEFTIRDETNRVMGGKSILDVLQDEASDVMQDAALQLTQVDTDAFAEVLSEDDLTEDEVKQIDADYAEYLRQQEEAETEAQRMLEKDQLKLDFEPGSSDDPSSPNYIPY